VTMTVSASNGYGVRGVGRPVTASVLPCGVQRTTYSIHEQEENPCSIQHKAYSIHEQEGHPCSIQHAYDRRDIPVACCEGHPYLSDDLFELLGPLFQRLSVTGLCQNSVCVCVCACVCACVCVRVCVCVCNSYSVRGQRS
jgi:hypothetical protein